MNEGIQGPPAPGAHCVAGDMSPSSLPVGAPAFLWLHRQPSRTLPAQARRVVNGSSLRVLWLHFPPAEPLGLSEYESAFWPGVRPREDSSCREETAPAWGQVRGECEVLGADPLAECQPTAGLPVTVLQLWPLHTALQSVWELLGQRGLPG